MQCTLETSKTPARSYRDYIARLAQIDPGYDGLRDFFDGLDKDRPNSFPPVQDVIPVGNGIAVIDLVQDSLEFRAFDDNHHFDCDELRQCLQDRPNQSASRIVLISYGRTWLNGKLYGVDTDVLATLAGEFRVHPEIMQMHFVSAYGLNTPNEPDPDYVLSPWVRSRYFHLTYLQGFLTASFHSGCTCKNNNTAVIIARNEVLEDHEPLLFSGINFLADLPSVDVEKSSLTLSTNQIYLQRLGALSKDEILGISKNLFEIILPYAQIAAASEHHRMGVWKSRATNAFKEIENFTFPQDDGGPSDPIVADESVAHRGQLRLSWRFSEQHRTLINIKSNLRELRKLIRHRSSRRVTEILGVFEEILDECQDQLNELQQKINQTTSLVALRESNLGILISKQALQQGERVKSLTYLAFIFAPLGTIASLFSMNLSAMQSGSAQIWMFLIAVVMTYSLVAAVWFGLTKWRDLVDVRTSIRGRERRRAFSDITA